MQPTDFAVVDVETTGLSPALKDRICEIAIVQLRGDQEGETFSTLVNPGRAISSGAFAVNGITNSMVANAPPFREVASEVTRRLSGCVFVAHNAPFDLRFLRAEFQRLQLPLPVSHLLDTLHIARRYYSFPSNNLGSLAAHFNLSSSQQHRALHDARMAAQLLRIFVRDLAHRNVGQVEDFVTAVEHSTASKTKAVCVLPSALREAHDYGLSLEIGYRASNLETSRRRIDPIDILVGSRTVYIRAYCHLRQEERVFRLDRITEMRLIEKDVSPPVVTAERSRRLGKTSAE